jgi:hypothetical protein
MAEGNDEYFMVSLDLKDILITYFASKVELITCLPLPLK